MPVFDHITMSGAIVMVFKGGKGQALTDPLILPMERLSIPMEPMPP